MSETRPAPLSRPTSRRAHAGLLSRVRRSGGVLLLCTFALCATAQAQAPQPGVMKGVVTDARGVPLAGAQVVADNTLFYNTNAIGISDAQGRYSIDVSRPLGTWAPSATITRTYNGRRYEVSLHPDNPDVFAGNDGAIRNFTWKLSGERPDGLGTYGMSVIYYFEPGTWEDPHHPGEFLDVAHVELTLQPGGPLLDGSSGQTIVAFGSNTPDGPAVRDVPIGRYAISARYVAPDRAPRRLLLRVRNTGEFVPQLVTDFEEVVNTLYQIEMDLRFDLSHVFDSGFEPSLG